MSNVFAAITKLDLKANRTRPIDVANILAEMQDCGDVVEFVPLMGMYGLYFEENEYDALLRADELTILDVGSVIHITGTHYYETVKSFDLTTETVVLSSGREVNILDLNASALAPGTFFLSEFDPVAFTPSFEDAIMLKNPIAEEYLTEYEYLDFMEQHQTYNPTDYRVRCFDTHCGDEYDISGEFTLSGAGREVEQGNKEFLSGGIYYYSVKSRQAKEEQALEELKELNPALYNIFNKEK